MPPPDPFLCMCVVYRLGARLTTTVFRLGAEKAEEQRSRVCLRVCIPGRGCVSKVYLCSECVWVATVGRLPPALSEKGGQPETHRPIARLNQC